jgi:hypothetical protein
VTDQDLPTPTKKPWYKKWWVWVLIAMGVLIVAAILSPTPEEETAALGDTTTTEASESTTTFAGETATTVDDTTTTQPATTTTTQPPTTTTTEPPFEPILLEGSGTDVVDVELPNDPYIVTITGNTASRHFAVTNYDDANNRIDLLVNTTDPYEGTRPLDWLDGEHTARFEVEGQGPWTILIESLSSARTVNAPGGTIDGDSDDVFGVISSDPLDTATINGNPNGRHFAVTAYGLSGRDLLVNTTDPYEGRVIVPSDALFFDVAASGAGSWTITFEG